MREERLIRMNERIFLRTCRPRLNSWQIQFIQLQLRRKIEYFEREARDEKYRSQMENNIKSVQETIQSLDKAMKES